MRKLLIPLLLTGCGTASPSSSTDVAPSGGGSKSSAQEPGAMLRKPGAVLRGEAFFGVSERFNRYYTDTSYQPSRTIYVSRTGKGDGKHRNTPASVDAGFSQIRAGEQLTFLADTTPYRGCWELDGDQSGTYDAPIVIYAERNADGSRGVRIDCCETGRSTCFNLEFADYVAIDGFRFQGGKYGIRTVGEGYTPSDNQRGIAMLNNDGGDQCADPFFSGQSSWIVVDGNRAHGGGECDGHGIYLSNGGDYMVVRGNNVYGNQSSDFQINADPISTCEDEDIEYDDPRCDGPVAKNQGRGVSEFIVVENNYFHHGDGPGPNFTSVRNSVIRNNIIGPHARHGTSFWQETENPKLGSANNIVHHNLFLGNTRKHILQFIGGATNNDVQNNLIISTDNRSVLLESDTNTNTMRGNLYVGSDRFDGYSPGSDEQTVAEFDPVWFANYPTDANGSINDFQPTTSAPFREAGPPLSTTQVDMTGRPRLPTTTLGPLEAESSLLLPLSTQPASSTSNP